MNPSLELPMFAFDRSALAVLAPLILLLAVVLLSNRDGGSVATPQEQAQAGSPQDVGADDGRGPGFAAGQRDQTVAANLASR
jgi:hypothetical protein